MQQWLILFFSGLQIGKIKFIQNQELISFLYHAYAKI